MDYVTLDEVLQRLDTLKPNNYSRGEKVAWLNALDGKIYSLSVLTHEAGGEAFSPYGVEEGNRTMLVPEPYGTELYLAWLESQVDYYDGDTVRYNNAMDRFMTLHREFSRWYHRTHKPLGQDRKYR